MLPPIKITKPRNPKPDLPAPIRPRLDTNDEAELLTGEVRGMKASMAEERFFKYEVGKSRKVQSWEFRYTLGAPRGLPGWKELDGLIVTYGLAYAVEIDSPFTHRNKREADRLHDAIILKELEQQGIPIFPQVIHIDGESELYSRESTRQTFNRIFGE